MILLRITAGVRPTCDASRNSFGKIFFRTKVIYSGTFLEVSTEITYGFPSGIFKGFDRVLFSKNSSRASSR